MSTFLSDYRSGVIQALSAVDLAQVGRAIGVLEGVRKDGRRVFACGNGGSAATASHFACDLGKGAGFKVFALGDSFPTVTALANDEGYEAVFVRQLEVFARSGDVLVAFSGSGNSPNVLRAVAWANRNGVRTVAFTGRDGGRLGELADIEVRAEEQHMGRIEDVHLAVAHMIAYALMDSPL